MHIDSARVEEVFNEALAKPDVGARAAYLDDACAGNVALFERVQALLAAHDATENRLVLPESNATTIAYVPLAERPGTKIGRYKLLEQIGEGGFGVVFMAEQEEPVRRRVALKIIKLGMDTKQVVARFEAERQALAMLDHPNIAKVLDGGATNTGRTYFVMELVKGVPITSYCDQNKLSTKDRLNLFVDVCAAVQHAHQKGIIHRDLKPTNVLVTMHDDRPVPKIIDFGIAKATQARLTEKTLFTEFRQMIGTPAYMSPEQAQMSGIDIDTRSDIYSLGVLLYELLTGSPPFGTKQLLSAGFDEMQRMIREVDPPPPSTRLIDSKDSLASISAQRQTEPSKLTRLMRGDLDWIVMRCLEKDRARRYETATGLAQDIERYLSDQPVEARRPTRAYRLKKFVRRNKFSVLAGSAILVTLVLGLTLASIGFIQAQRQAEIAHKQAVRSEKVAQFLKDALSSAGPSVSRGRNTEILREILDKTAMRIGIELKDDPEIQGDLWYTLGATYSDIVDRAKAAAMFSHAVESYRRAFGNESLKLALALGQLGRCQGFIGDTSTGVANARLGLDMARISSDSDALTTCLFSMGHAFDPWGAGSSEGVPFFQEAVALQRKLGKNPVVLANMMSALANSLTDAQIDFVQAESLTRESLALHRQFLGSDHPASISDMLLLGDILVHRGKYSEAETDLSEVSELYHKVHDENNPYQAIVLRFLAEAQAGAGKLDEAETNFRKALGVAKQTAMNDSELVRLLIPFAIVLERKQQHAEARKLAEESVKLFQKHSEWVSTGPHGSSLASLRSLLAALGDAAALEELDNRS